MKLAFLGEECVRCEPEYDDCRAIAEREGLPLREVYRKAQEQCACADGGHVSPPDS